MTSPLSRRIVLASRPQGEPALSDFRLEETPLPAPGPGQVLLRTEYLSLDPYMRGRMSAAPSYAPPVAIGETMVGGTVSRVEESAHPEFATGDWVVGMSGWQSRAVLDGASLRNLGARFEHPSLQLGALGMTGFTAYMGLLDIGQPQAGETVVVAAASGAVGSIVGQIARIKGCRIVGIAGGADKCDYVLRELGFDACIDHRTPDFAARLAEACPQGIDVYFESVGGAVFDAVLPLLNLRARVPMCGLISSYNATALPAGPDRLALLQGMLIKKRIRMQGFIVFDDYGHRFGEFYQAMSGWLAEGRIRFREDIVDGLENAPAAFIGLLSGRNFGKLLVRIGQD
ncbi:NADP-dependent oxidoreductase [Paludibacterium yongneupense]|uniref:NADP-dependent oxidoreductase n=1 Tax=Paludibacterium yongneupense TaxID=400061 RepID=UPI000409B309|nr:NADP-dependent oxidoreductase [Paludibacterium yongneupense]